MISELGSTQLSHTIVFDILITIPQDTSFNNHPVAST